MFAQRSQEVAADPRRCSRRADRDLDQVRNTRRDGRLESWRDFRCSIDPLGWDAHGRSKRHKIDGWVNDVHGDEAIGTRRRIMWLRSHEPLQDVVFPVVDHDKRYRKSFVSRCPQRLRRVQRCAITDDRDHWRSVDAE